MSRSARRAGALGLLALAACVEDPREDLEALRVAFEAGDADAIGARIHPEYSDALGDGRRLVSELASLFEAHPRRVLRLEEATVVRRPDDPLVVEVIGRLELELAGAPEWKLVAPLRVEYRPAGRLRARSGLFTELRDVRALFADRRAALEANDAEAAAALLHAGYRDGAVDRAEAARRLRTDLAGRRIRHTPLHYRVDARGDLVHVDERYRLEVDDQAVGPVLSRLTLRPEAGRWRIAAGLYRGDQSGE